jgi:hypothetical protein
MFNFLKKLTDNNRATIPEPLAGRDGHLGGIESIFLDNVTYFFGFDYRNDLALSPLINDRDAMACFASIQMY